MRHGKQQKLVDVPVHFKNGLVYRPNFISEEEEFRLLAMIENMPLKNSRFGEYTAKRRAIGFGWDYDYEKKKFIPSEDLPKFLQPYARKIAKWLDIPQKRVVEALINEYSPGTQIGWHRDTEEFEHIIGISLGGWARMRFRPLSGIGDPKKVVSLELEPRSAYIMQKDVRWRWQHSVAPTRDLRYSITFRTAPFTPK